jgi:hypothetical protein
MDFTKKNLTDAQYVSVDAASLIGANFTPVVETKIALKDLTQLELGTLTSAARSNNDKIYFTLKFWNKVPFSTSSSLYTRVGEDQVVVVGFKDEFDTTTTPTMTLQAPTLISSESVRINYTLVGSTNVAVRYINQLSSVAAPTRNALVSGTSIAGAAAGAKELNLSGLTAGTSYTIYMLAIDTNNNLANNVVSRTYTTASALAAIAVEGGTTLGFTASTGAVLASRDTFTLTLTGATFAADIATSGVTAANLPTGITFTVTRTSNTVITIALVSVSSPAVTAGTTNTVFTVAKEKITLDSSSASPAANYTTGNMTITAVA